MVSELEIPLQKYNNYTIYKNFGEFLDSIGIDWKTNTPLYN